MARRSTGNISAVKRGPNRLGPSRDRTLRCAASGQLEDTHCGREVSHSPFVCSHFFLQDQDQDPGEDGRTGQRHSLSSLSPFRLGQFVEGPTEANPSMLWDSWAACLYYGRFSSNPIQRVPWAPTRAVRALWVLDLPAIPSADHRICLLTRSAAARQ